MAFDFNPDLIPEEDEQKTKKTKITSEISKDVVQTESSLVAYNTAGTSDVVTINNLLGLTQSHIQDDNECREVVSNLTEELNNSLHLMSIKEMLEYLKVKLKEREFHVSCIFKAYAFIQRSEYAREMFIGSNRKERIIEATDRKRITNLLSILNDTDGTR